MHHAALTAGPEVDPLGRQLGDYESYRYEEGYSVWYEDCWKTSTDGPLIRSTLPGSRLHAPIFDLDMPATTQSSFGLTHLQVDGPVDRVKLLRNLRWLVRHQHVSPVHADEMRGDLADQIATDGRHGPVRVMLAHPTRLVESRTAGHHHLYLDRPMRFRYSVRLARKLGIFDVAHVKESAKTGFWVARRPLR